MAMSESSAASLTFLHYTVLFILVLSLVGGRRHHGASCYSELRKIRRACEIQWVAHAMGQSVLKPTWYSHGEANAQTDTVGTDDDGFCLYSQFCYNATIMFL